MNWLRLGRAAVASLLISFALGAILSPPDPFTQLLYAGPLFLVLFALSYRYGPGVWAAIRSHR